MKTLRDKLIEVLGEEEVSLDQQADQILQLVEKETWKQGKYQCFSGKALKDIVFRKDLITKVSGRIDEKYEYPDHRCTPCCEDGIKRIKNETLQEVIKLIKEI